MKEPGQRRESIPSSIPQSVRESVRRTIKESPLRHDLLHTLEFIERKGSVRLTKIRRTMNRDLVRELIDGFKEKPETWPPVKSSDEWRYPRLMMIDAIMHCLNLVEETGNKLTVTDIAREFRSLTVEDQFLNMFSIWWDYANWEVITGHPTIHPEGSEDDFFELIKYLRDTNPIVGTVDTESTARVEEQRSFRLSDIALKWRAVCSGAPREEEGQGPEQEQQDEGMARLSVKLLLIDPLVWFGLIQEGTNLQDSKELHYRRDSGDSLESQNSRNLLHSREASQGDQLPDPTKEFRISTLGSFIFDLIFSTRKQARLEAELAKCGRSLEGFYRHSMYGLEPLSPDASEQEEEHDRQIRPGYAS